MNKIQRFCNLLLLLTVFGLSAVHAQSYDKLWKQVELAQKQSLPQTVIKLTDEIYRKSEREQNAPQMLKAYLCKETYQQSLTPDSIYSNLRNMERWVLTEKNPVNKAILHSLLAREYADLMQNNRRALLPRTLLDVDEAPGDVREWSTNQFVSKIDEHNNASLQDSPVLLETSAEKFIPFIILEDGSRFYKHDMYHLLASRAISTYNDLSGFNVDTLICARINTIYENMINAYRHRASSEDAVLLCSLDYWDWKVTNGTGNEPYQTYRIRKEQIDKAHIQALNDLIQEYGNREVCAEVYIKKAIWLRTDGEGRSVAEALKVCDEGLKRYPSYKRINELKNIREQILQPELVVTTRESAYPGDSVNMNINFSNLSGFTLNLYATTLNKVPYMDHGINKDTYKKYARKLSSTHYDLQPLPGKGKLTEDVPYLSTDTVFKFKIPQETGVYILQIVPDVGTTPTEDKFLVSTRFKVLTLNLGDGRMEVTTLDASSGQPIADAKVSFYSSYNEENRKLLAELVTDAGGKAVLPWQKGISSYVASKGKDTAMMPQSVYMNRPNNDNKEVDWKTIALLTDRSLYRPGQTVYIKGIAYKQNNDSAHVLEGINYEVVLLDTNRKVLATKKVRTNDFGSFTTEFVLPAACLNGMFSVQTNDPRSTVSFRVEEYKRPTFEITFTPVSEAYRLGDKVLLKGNVKAFNGMMVQDVPLAYTVNRRNPRLSYWSGSEKPLLADTIQLNANGDFAIPLTLDAPIENEGRFGNVYTYSVEAVVTDEAGETQTASYNLLAGSKAYSFNVNLPQYICKEDSMFFTFGVDNIMSIPQNIKGTYKLYSFADMIENSKKEPKQVVLEGDFIANQRQDFSAWSKLPSGNYSLELSVRDSLGREENSGEYSSNRFLLFSKKDTRPAAFTNFFYYKENEEFDAQHPAAFLLGTSYKDAYVLMDVFCDQKRIESRALQLNDTIIRMEYPYKESYGNGVSILFNFVKGGEMYSQQIYLKKRQPERTLDMKWEVFRDRLHPGQEEEWKLVIKTPQGMPAAAEMLATMYDASLDKIFKRNQLLRVFYPDNLYSVYRNASYFNNSYFSIYFPLKAWRVPKWRYDYFYSPYGKVENLSQIVEDGTRIEATVMSYRSDTKSTTGGLKIRGAANMAAKAGAVQEEAEDNLVTDVVFESEKIPVGRETLQSVPGLRTNFAETAFFYPQLRTNELGEVAFSFTMPQSLTRWNFCGYSHTKNMMTGMLDATAVTAKEFMLTPNMPRFVRVGDETQIAATISNLSGKAVKGTATFTLFDPMTEKIISSQRQKFSVEAGRTTAVNFHFETTDRYDLLGVRMVADGGTFSDGEQHLLPILSNKDFITETLAMPIRGEETRTFSLDSLFNHNARTATERRLTVEFTGNPAWYAVQALPVLSLPSTDNAISWATAYYANSLAGYIANSQPSIKAVFDSWKLAGGTKNTFLSQLENNQDVKNILLDESPWLLEATTEAEQQARIATLFDVNQMNGRNLSAFTKLKELQGEDGGWSWYKGMSGSQYITGYITELLVRLPLMTKEQLPSEVVAMKQKAFDFLHKQALEEYRMIRKAEKDGAKITTISDATMNYLYLVALGNEKVPAANEAAYRYFLSMVSRNLENGTMVCKAQSAIILLKAGRTSQANEFVASIKEHLVQTNEMGAHFAFYANPYAWGMLPIPAHVEVMEALLMAGGNETLVEEMKLWLLKQKQTTSWDSPIATADAVYALLCQGSDLLDNRGDVRITLGNKVMETLSPAKTAVPGLGYIKETFTQGSPELKAKSITVEKRDAGIAWGAVYAQYLSPISDVKQQGGELNIEKKLYIERIAADGKKSLQPIADATQLSVGDKVVSRLTISLDRAMDFIQLKDQRGACFEPVGALSGYRWNNGFGYFVEVEDAATNFFFDHLGKGVYVLEHSYRIARGGTYEAGLATIQCAYAPEYASHSTGGTVVIK
ncbi:alpha-2-macroglobulin family protein [Bacteroides sp.]|uniref:alpha-2-macroglobulin family protein n=1 Tax=Bacteroides sp. TaxID=29523 RepID=UPI00262E1D5B|nr:alpha-2-macroglobulin family protein [Bacteroides sp.]